VPTCVPYDPAAGHDHDDLRRHRRAILPDFVDHYRAHHGINGSNDGRHAHNDGALYHCHLGARYSTHHHDNHRATHNDNNQPADHHNDYYGADDNIYDAAAPNNLDNEASSHDHNDTGADDNGDDPARHQADYVSSHHDETRPHDEAPPDHRDDASAPHDHDEAPADDGPSAPHDDDRAGPRHTAGYSRERDDYHHRGDHLYKADPATDDVYVSSHHQDKAPCACVNDKVVPGHNGP
jgi:hypothetical protein